MSNTSPTITVSPQVGAFLTQVTETSDLGTALWKVLSDYIELKTNFLRENIQAFETKWGMSFEEFSGHCEDGTLDRSAYDYEVESDFWEWEKAETLSQHYDALQARWM